MADVRDGLNLDDGDRLPWLEPATLEDDDGGVSPARLIGLVVAGLIVLGAIIYGAYWLKSRGAAGGGDTGEGKLIAAPAGDYKTPANDARGKAFQGEGDTSFATSEGAERSAKLDLGKVPETPMTGVSRGSVTKADADKPAPAAGSRVEAKVTTAPATPAKAPDPGGKASGPMIQLGAYASDANAREAWTRLSKRFTYLAPLTSSVQSAKVGDTTFYRLRADAGSAAQASLLCGKLKVAGETCIVVN
jgi:hypothetical protein